MYIKLLRLRYCSMQYYIDSTVSQSTNRLLSFSFFNFLMFLIHTLLLHTLLLDRSCQVVPVRSLPGRRSLRSTGTNRLLVSSVKRSTVRSRVFPVAGPKTWNSLPEDATSSHLLIHLSPPAQDVAFQEIFYGHRHLID